MIPKTCPDCGWDPAQEIDKIKDEADLVQFLEESPHSFIEFVCIRCGTIFGDPDDDEYFGNSRYTDDDDE